MIVISKCLILFSLILNIMQCSVAAIDLDKIRSELQAKYPDLQNTYDNKVRPWDDNHVCEYFFGSYVNGKYKDVLQDENVFVTVMEINFSGFGNKFGFYFEMLQAANVLGAHFIGIWRSSPPKHFEAFPTLVVNQNPSNYNESIKNTAIIGNGCGYPWQDYIHAYWRNGIGNSLNDVLTGFIRSYMKEAYPTAKELKDLYFPLSILDESNLQLRKDKVHIHTNDMANFVNNDAHLLKYFRKDNEAVFGNISFPMIPDAAISIRCNDVLHHFKTFSPYGFINFNVYAMLIPKSSRLIYVMTEPLHYNNGENSKACEKIISMLVLFLHTHAENSTVSVLRGNQFESILIIKEAPLVICTATTYCLWPGLTNQYSVYFPVSWLVSEGKEYYLSPKFHWITYPQLQSFEYKARDDPTGQKLVTVLQTLLNFPTVP